jgi:hypothetical protein
MRIRSIVRCGLAHRAVRHQRRAIATMSQRKKANTDKAHFNCHIKVV